MNLNTAIKQGQYWIQIWQKFEWGHHTDQKIKKRESHVLNQRHFWVIYKIYWSKLRMLASLQGFKKKVMSKSALKETPWTICLHWLSLALFENFEVMFMSALCSRCVTLVQHLRRVRAGIKREENHRTFLQQTKARNNKKSESQGQKSVNSWSQLAGKHERRRWTAEQERQLTHGKKERAACLLMLVKTRISDPALYK